ncbi:MAG: monoamine oxidase [Phycisphaerae bacterium]|nr:MAG: monoamine oxidase [Phycisphaerae bacterium]
MPRFFRVLNRRFGPLSHLSPDELRDQRRRMLKVSLAAGAGLLLSGCASLGGRSRPNGKRVVIVGAGFAGLACAHELRAVGYDVVVIDARKRVGGRVLSLRDFIPGKVAEGGAELIGSNHVHWQAYAARFRLKMLDMSDDPVPIELGGRLIEGEEGEALWAGVEGACSKMNDLAKDVDAEQPWRTPDAARLDARPLSWWIQGLGAPPDVKLALAANLGGDNGVPVDRLSLLAMLSQVKGGGLSRFWEETEVARCAGGNQQLAECFARELGSSRLMLGTPATEIRADGPASAVTLADGTVVQGDSVVLAVPPTTWPKLRVRPWFDRAAGVQLGSNVKYLTRVKRRFWAEKGRSAYTLSDGEINWTWESTDGQGDRGEFGLTAFCGGEGSEAVRSRTPEARDARLAEAFEGWFPGYRANLAGVRFMDWPGDPWTLGAYSAFAPGQITTAGSRLHEGLGNLQFAGEHCSFAFMGYMEGALHSGVSVARRIAARDGMKLPPRVDLPAEAVGSGA